MNIFYKKMSSLVLAGLIAMPAYAVSQEEFEETVWYKKRAVVTHVAKAAGALGILGMLYVVATHMDKIVVPAALLALVQKFSAVKAENVESMKQNDASALHKQEQQTVVPVTQKPQDVAQKPQDVSPIVSSSTVEKPGVIQNTFSKVSSFFTSLTSYLPQNTEPTELDVMRLPY